VLKSFVTFIERDGLTDRRMMHDGWTTTQHYSDPNKLAELYDGPQKIKAAVTCEISSSRIYRYCLFVETYPSSSVLVSTFDIISSYWRAAVVGGLPPSYLDEIAVAVHYFWQVWSRRWLCEIKKVKYVNTESANPLKLSLG
jgi:hypothetical protein